MLLRSMLLALTLAACAHAPAPRPEKAGADVSGLSVFVGPVEPAGEPSCIEQWKVFTASLPKSVEAHLAERGMRVVADKAQPHDTELGIGLQTQCGGDATWGHLALKLRQPDGTPIASGERHVTWDRRNDAQEEAGHAVAILLSSTDFAAFAAHRRGEAR